MKAIVLTKYGTPDDLGLKELAKALFMTVWRPSTRSAEIGAAFVRAEVRGKPLFMRAFAGLLRPKISIMGAM